MATDFWIKQGDTSPSIAATLKDADDNAVDLAGASVRFHMAVRPGHGTTKVDAAATITDAAAGQVKYDWSAGDTDTVGDWDAEWEVTYSTGKVETFPNDGFTVVRILREIA